ncbi:unnamed protein product [Spodoptera exigua]|nr:unnamed protein product [Spodoptera exigua]
MDFRIVQVLALWILCINIEMVASMPSQNVNARTKRSPANNFSVFGLNLGSALSATKQAASKTYTSIENIFTGKNNTPKPPGVIEANPIFNMPPEGRPNTNIVPSATQRSVEETNKNVFSPDKKFEVDKTIVTEKSQIPNDVPNTTTAPPIDVKDQGKEKNTENQNIENEIDKELLDYIFRSGPTNYNSATDNSLDNSIDDTTSTGEFETTTLSLDNRIQPAVVASLLG